MAVATMKSFIECVFSTYNLVRVGLMVKKATNFRNSTWRPLPSWIFENIHFWCNICVQCHILNMATDFQNWRRRRPPYWIAVNMHFWCNGCVICQNFNILTKFGEDRFNSKEMATDFRNSRWRRPPSWKLHFRLNRHYEKAASGLLLPIKNLTFVRLS